MSKTPLTSTVSTASRLARLSAQISLLAVAAALAACGGGGGDDNTPPAPAPAPAPGQGGVGTGNGSGEVAGGGMTAAGAAQTDAGTTTYGASSAAVFEFINAQRTAAGVGVVIQAAALDVAAGAHASYLAINNDLGASHSESTTRAGFYGERVGNRALAANYMFNLVVEDIAPELNSPIEGARDLLTTPYHRLGLLDHRPRDIGLGYAESTSTSVVPGSTLGLLVPVLGHTSAGPQQMRSSSRNVGIYPMDGATDVPLMMGAEAPNPVAAELGPWGPGKYPGYTVSLQVPSDKDLVVSSFTLMLVNSGGNVPVSAKLLDKNDATFLLPNGFKNWAHLVPLAPLTASSTYEASLTGTVSGAALTKTWRFSTNDASFTASAPRRDTSGARVIVDYRTPSGYLQAQAVTPQNCGAGYAIGFGSTKQSVFVREIGAVPIAGCMLSVTVLDRGTGLTDTRALAAN